MIVDGKFVFNPQFEWTGGGFASTPEELARWAQALYGGRVLGKEMQAQMLTGVDAGQGRGGAAATATGWACRFASRRGARATATAAGSRAT